MEDLIHTVLASLGGIIVAISGMVIAYFNKKKKELETTLKQKDLEITDLKNGWRKGVEDRLSNLEQSFCQNCREVKANATH